MNDEAAKGIHEDIRYNTTNLGALGKFIRVEHVYNILDRYTITGRTAGAELEATRIQRIRELLTNSGATGLDMRQTLESIYRIINP